MLRDYYPKVRRRASSALSLTASPSDAGAAAVAKYDDAHSSALSELAARAAPVAKYDDAHSSALSELAARAAAVAKYADAHSSELTARGELAARERRPLQSTPTRISCSKTTTLKCVENL